MSLSWFRFWMPYIRNVLTLFSFSWCFSLVQESSWVLACDLLRKIALKNALLNSLWVCFISLSVSLKYPVLTVPNTILDAKYAEIDFFIIFIQTESGSLNSHFKKHFVVVVSLKIRTTTIKTHLCSYKITLVWGMSNIQTFE